MSILINKVLFNNLSIVFFSDDDGSLFTYDCSTAEKKSQENKG